LRAIAASTGAFKMGARGDKDLDVRDRVRPVASVLLCGSPLPLLLLIPDGSDDALGVFLSSAEATSGESRSHGSYPVDPATS